MIAALLGTIAASRRFFRLLHGKADLSLRVDADDLDLHLLSLCHKIPNLADIASGDLRDMNHAHDPFPIGVMDIHKCPIVCNILYCALIDFPNFDLHVTPYPFLMTGSTAAMPAVMCFRVLPRQSLCQFLEAS